MGCSISPSVGVDPDVSGVKPDLHSGKLYHDPGAFFRDNGPVRRHNGSLPFIMAERAIAPTLIPKTYAELRRAVEVTLIHGQRAIEHAKVRTYWETGRLIKEHLLFNADRAEYGAQVIPRLARDLGANERTLYECLKFARVFPILSGRSELTWAHYRKLIQVAAPAQRKALMAEAIKGGWTSDALADRVVQLNAALNPAPLADARGSAALGASMLLIPKRGTPGLHLIVDRGPST